MVKMKKLPKIELKYSWMYNSLFDKSFNKEDIPGLKLKCNNFETIYKKNIDKILRLIADNFFAWKEEYIPIFIIDKGSIFCDPVTIRYEKDSKEMLLRVFHELVHVNIKNKKFKNEYVMHKWMDGKMIPLLEKTPTKLLHYRFILDRMTNKWKDKVSR